MIPLFKVFMSENASAQAVNVLNSGYIGQGEQVEVFENNLKKYFNNDFVLTLNAGTSGLHLALHLLKNKNGKWPGLSNDDEVLCTPLTCTASNWPVLANNLKIKWVDIDEKTLNIDLDDLERKITEKTKVIILVHWGGYPNDLDRLKEIQKNTQELYGFKPAIIEDAAHAFGSKYKEKHLGNHGNIVMYSLQAIKHITSVDGGLLFLPHIELYNRAKLIRWYGIDRNTNKKDFRCEADIMEWGFKFHMNDVNASIGNENLKHADEIINKHKDNALFYDNNLKEISGVTLLERHVDRESSFWIYSFLVENRDKFYSWMKECGIMVSQVHERNDKHSCVSEFRSFLPTLEKTINKVVSIPVGWWVTEENRKYIVECIKKGW